PTSARSRTLISSNWLTRACMIVCLKSQVSGRIDLVKNSSKPNSKMCQLGYDLRCLNPENRWEGCTSRSSPECSSQIRRKKRLNWTSQLVDARKKRLLTALSLFLTWDAAQSSRHLPR